MYVYIVIDCFFIIEIAVESIRSYFVNESVGIVQPLLLLSNPSSFNETVEIRTGDFNANGNILSVHM